MGLLSLTDFSNAGDKICCCSQLLNFSFWLVTCIYNKYVIFFYNFHNFVIVEVNILYNLLIIAPIVFTHFGGLFLFEFWRISNIN